MSNIHTSYIRTYRRDGAHLNKEEIEMLFRRAVQSYGTFGSYWVRILKYYREVERCLDIQFGSGKRYHSDSLLEQYDIYNTYFVWERFADEGGFDDHIFTLEEEFYDKQKYISTTERKPCLYRFNKVKLICDELSDYFQQFDPLRVDFDSYLFNLAGTYYACNSRSFVDLHEDSDFYGPRLGYDPSSASDYFVPTEDGIITSSELPLINAIFIDHSQLLPMMRVELYWNNRLVQAVEHKHDQVYAWSADYWDNCANSDFLLFKESFYKVKQSNSRE
ncbi:MAG: hypothetical protein ACFB0B_11660 [Thermonemataceae bacterium]|mgnify:CR=1 FL=1